MARSSIQPDGAHLRFWMKREGSINVSRQGRSETLTEAIRTLHLVDCRRRAIATLEQFGSVSPVLFRLGESDRRLTEPTGEFIEFPPDSLGAEIALWVCEVRRKGLRDQKT